MTEWDAFVAAHTDDAPDPDACGVAFDHDEMTTYEDAGTHMWECRRCGVEGGDLPAGIARRYSPST